MTGEPPTVLLDQLLAGGIDPTSPYYVIAREWERRPMGEGLWHGFQRATRRSTRQTAAWLIKCFPAASTAAAILERASQQDEDVQVRGLLIQAIDLLAFGREVSWGDTKPAFERLLADTEPVIRERAAGALGSFPVSDEIVHLLEARAADPSDDVAKTARYVLSQLRK